MKSHLFGNQTALMCCMFLIQLKNQFIRVVHLGMNDYIAADLYFLLYFKEPAHEESFLCACAVCL